MYSDKYDDLRGALSIDGFCKLYGVGRTSAYEQIKERKLRAVKDLIGVGIADAA